MLRLIDNYDSFTFNVVSYLGQLGIAPSIVKNDQTSVAEIDCPETQAILISPGPGTPDEAGVSLSLITHLSGHYPILGICLGHETIAQAFGARVVHAREVMHGKVSTVYHDGRGVFLGVPNPVQVARYHSLIVDKDSLPDSLEISAWTLDADGNPDEIMGLRHKHHQTEGIQFHPEAILTEYGHLMLANFVRCFRPLPVAV